MGRTLWMLHCNHAHLRRTGHVLILHGGERPVWGLPVYIPDGVWELFTYRALAGRL